MEMELNRSICIDGEPAIGLVFGCQLATRTEEKLRRRIITFETAINIGDFRILIILVQILNNSLDHTAHSVLRSGELQLIRFASVLDGNILLLCKAIRTFTSHRNSRGDRGNK